MSSVNSATRQVWLLTDGKPGHLNQLRGLAAQLASHCPVSLHWLNVAEIKLSWWQWLTGRAPEMALPSPDLVMAAGHATHRHLLLFGRRFNCPTTVLMKPSLPLTWFDYAIVPIHDQPPSRTNILATRGALNTVQPRVRAGLPSRGLILLGGESRHYNWDTAGVILQLETLVAQSPDIAWVLSDSRRTPPELLPQLQTRLPDIKVLPHQQTGAGWVAEQMDLADCLWVTPDSVSMVYEALTSGAQVGLLRLAIDRENRINRSIEALRQQGLVNSVDGINDPGQHQRHAPLWEADRAARWLLEQLGWSQSLY